MRKLERLRKKLNLLLQFRGKVHLLMLFSVIFTSVKGQKKFSVIRGRLRQNDKLRFRTCANQGTDTGEEFLYIALKEQSLELVLKFHYLDDTIEAKGVQWAGF